MSKNAVAAYIAAAAALAAEYNALNVLITEAPDGFCEEAFYLTNCFVKLEGERSAFFRSCDWDDIVWNAFIGALDKSPYWRFSI